MPVLIMVGAVNPFQVQLQLFAGADLVIVGATKFMIQAVNFFEIAN